MATEVHTKGCAQAWGRRRQPPAARARGGRPATLPGRAPRPSRPSSSVARQQASVDRAGTRLGRLLLHLAAALPRLSVLVLPGRRREGRTGFGWRGRHTMHAALTVHRVHACSAAHAMGTAPAGAPSRPPLGRRGAGVPAAAARRACMAILLRHPHHHGRAPPPRSPAPPPGQAAPPACPKSTA